MENYSNFTQSSTRLEYLYNGNTKVGFVYTAGGVNKGAFYFLRNLQGDVVAIYNANGTKVVEYSYDAYGNCTITSSTTDYSLANVNPIRYRGYYFDQETGWYFLNARYYSPEWRRFISPDDTSYLDLENVNGCNLYCYCSNNPVNFVDQNGNEPLTVMLSLLGEYVVALALLALMGVAITMLAGKAKELLREKTKESPKESPKEVINEFPFPNKKKPIDKTESHVKFVPVILGDDSNPYEPLEAIGRFVNYVAFNAIIAYNQSVAIIGGQGNQNNTSYFHYISGKGIMGATGGSLFDIMCTRLLDENSIWAFEN